MVLVDKKRLQQASEVVCDISQIAQVSERQFLSVRPAAEQARQWPYIQRRWRDDDDDWQSGDAAVMRHQWSETDRHKSSADTVLLVRQDSTRRWRRAACTRGHDEMQDHVLKSGERLKLDTENRHERQQLSRVLITLQHYKKTQLNEVGSALYATISNNNWSHLNWITFRHYVQPPYLSLNYATGRIVYNVS